MNSLDGKQIFGVGTGGGLFSSVARRLAETVHPFDYDPISVASNNELKRCYCPDDKQRRFERGTLLDNEYLETLGRFDVVYSWGVLHHTRGHVAVASKLTQLVKKRVGVLFIAIYNDQDIMSRFWHRVKHIYKAGFLCRVLMKTIFYPWFAFRTILASVVKYHNPVGKFKEYKKNRGMSVVRDLEDWLGGYPFEVAKPESIIDFYIARGFKLTKYKSTNRLGCNEFVLKNEGTLIKCAE